MAQDEIGKFSSLIKKGKYNEAMEFFRSSPDLRYDIHLSFVENKPLPIHHVHNINKDLFVICVERLNISGANEIYRSNPTNIGNFFKDYFDHLELIESE